MATGAAMLVAALPSAAAAQPLNLLKVVGVTAPSNAATNPYGILSGVTCTSSGTCEAVGYYEDTAGYRQAMAAVETAGGWSRATEITAPSGAATSPFSSPTSVSCTSVGTCVAVGYYEDTSNHIQGMAATETSGKWAQAVKITAPTNAVANPDAEPFGVTCTSVGNCVAVGEYSIGGGGFEAMEATEKAGSWAQAVEVTPPTNAATLTVASLQGVACTSAGNCVAVGGYWDTADFGFAMEARETSGTWGEAVELSPPSNATANSNEVLNSVSCVSAGNCEAVGYYQDTHLYIQSAAASESAGTWNRATEVTAPAGSPANPGAILAGVSCGSAGNCLAVGSYQIGGTEKEMQATEVAGDWGTAVAPSLPANAGSALTGQLFGVSCTSVVDCTSAGTYTDSSGYTQAMASTVTAPPAVTKVSPASGSSTGGTLVTISGSDFGGATAVRFGSVPAKSERVISPTEIQATAPPGAIGKVDVSVTTPAGTSAKTSADQFSYVLGEGYWLAVRSGGVYAAGAAPSLGGVPSSVATSSNPVVGISGTPDGQGYVVSTANGTVEAFGTAKFYGDLPSRHIHPNLPVVAVAETADGGGYWLLASDGGFFAFGDAKYRGSVPGLGQSVSDVVTMEASPVGIGYWMAGGNGKVWNFGSAGFYNDLPTLHVHPNLPIVAMLPSSTGKGYVLVASDGGAFKFGSGVHYYGSLPGIGVKVTDVIGLALTPDDGGYFIGAANSGVWGFGDAKAQPTPAGLTSHLPVVAIAGI